MSDATGFTLLVFLSVLAILIWLLPVAGKWKVYGKLGMPGWYSIIPVYADYKLCERVHRGDETRTFLLRTSSCSSARGLSAGSTRSVCFSPSPSS